MEDAPRKLVVIVRARSAGFIARTTASESGMASSRKAPVPNAKTKRPRRNATNSLLS